MTLIELALVITVVGMVALITLPTISRVLPGQHVRNARFAITSMHAQARAIAVKRGTQTVLDLRDGVLVIRSVHPVTGVVDTVGAVERMSDRYNVQVRTSRDSLVFDPRGLGVETSPTYIHVAAANRADTIRVSMLGRVLP